MAASLPRSTTVRRACVVAVVSVLASALTTLACSGGDEAAADDALPTSSVYVPAEAAAQNPIPPGVSPRAPDNPQPQPTPTDSGSSGGNMDSGSTPKPDASDGSM